MPKTPMCCITGYIVVLLFSYCCDANILDGKAIMCVYENTSISFSESLPIERRQTTTEETPQTTTEESPHYVQLLQGRDGRDGRDGVPGPRGLSGRDGKTGEKGMMGDTGPQGPPGPMTGGVTYVRWGRTTCPDTEGTEVVYSGRAAGSHYSHQGGGANYQCITEEPANFAFGPGTVDHSYMY